jgi:hypothetical protein
VEAPGINHILRHGRGVAWDDAVLSPAGTIKQVSLGSRRWNDRNGATISTSLYKSQIETDEHQDNSYVYGQPSPELMPKEQEIDSDHNGYHQYYVKYDDHLSSHSYLSPAIPLGC